MYTSCLDIDLRGLEKNIETVRKSIGGRVKLCGVVKADAYGLGIAGIGPLFAESPLDMLGVARYGEALELRRYLGEGDFPVLVMGLCDDDELADSLGRNITLSLDRIDQARLLSRAAVAKGKTAKVHIKVDTGFGRLGLRSEEEGSLSLYEEISRLPGIQIKGTFSHLALAGREEDEKQVNRFNRFCAALKNRGVNVGIRHICDSIGTFRYPNYRMDMVRAGAILYGMKPSGPSAAENLDLDLPVRWTSKITRVVRLREGEGVGYDYLWKAPAGGATVATVPVGYADGYPRLMSRGGRVLVKGVSCPVAGLICMDQMMVDVSALDQVRHGDEVVLLGEQKSQGKGRGQVSIDDLARWGGTNRNEILARIGRRVLRRYYRDGKTVGELAYLDEPSYREYN